MPLQCVIVDDEPLARDLLRSMLAEIEDVEVVAEFGEGKSAVEGIRDLRPELVFLDIQMPERDGFEVIAELAPDELPAVVFVTAYDEYALRAFEVHALDYLLKPFDRERLERTVRRAVDQLRRPGGGDRQGLMSLLQQLNRERRQQQRLVIKVRDRIYLQDVEEIDWIEANGRFVDIHVGDQTHSMRDTMQNMKETLDPTRFVRVSRSAIVNLDRVAEIQPWFSGDLVLIMRNGTNITTTRGYRDRLKDILNG